jgi:hypothetical protein
MAITIGDGDDLAVRGLGCGLGEDCFDGGLGEQGGVGGGGAGGGGEKAAGFEGLADDWRGNGKGRGFFRSGENSPQCGRYKMDGHWHGGFCKGKWRVIDQ